METLLHVLLVLHLLGWAVVFGGVLTSLREPHVPRTALHGILTALVTGILMVGVASSMPDEDLNYVWVGIKLLIALAVTALVIVGQRQPERVSKGYLGAIAGLIVVNVSIAVLW